MDIQYKKHSDGNHFYKIGENILHISHFTKDETITNEYEKLTTIFDVKKGDCCINNIEKLPDNLINISKEEFENKLRKVIYILGIYEYTKSN